MARLSKPTPARPELERRLAEAKGHRLTPAERWATILGALAFCGGVPGFIVAVLAGYGWLSAALLLLTGVGALALGWAHERLNERGEI